MIPPVAHRLQKRIKALGGVALDGRALFRVVRGSDVFTTIGGKWNKFDEHGNQVGTSIGAQTVLKYPQYENRYILEMLMPPESFGTPEQWEKDFTEWIDGQKVQSLGEFPRSGEYEMVKVIETPRTKQFVPLTEAICDACVAMAKLNKELPERIKREAAKERREIEEKQREENLVDKINDMGMAFGGRPTIAVPDMSEIAKYS